MNTTTSEQKATELAEYYYAYDVSKDNCEHYDLYAAAMEMHEWTKQQLIDKLEDWLANNICNAYNFCGDDISATFINDCIKAMKGE